MFNMGYPKRTGDAQKDFDNLYNFVCEMADRLRHQFDTTEKISEKENDQAEE